MNLDNMDSELPIVSLMSLDHIREVHEVVILQIALLQLTSMGITSFHSNNILSPRFYGIKKDGGDGFLPRLFVDYALFLLDHNKIIEILNAEFGVLLFEILMPRG